MAVYIEEVILICFWPQSFLNVFYIGTGLQQHSCMSMPEGMVVKIFKAKIVMNHTAAVLHNSGLDIGTIFTTVYHMNRLSASIGIQGALIVHIELSIKQNCS